MLVCKLARVVLAAATLLGQSVTAKSHCFNPSVRREWRTLASDERAEWISAVKCLTTLPHNSSLVPTHETNITAIPPVNASCSYFDDWVYVHMDLNPLIHFTGHFLPWHRAYVKDFETALREKCGYTGAQPYWDWTLDASDFYNSSFWDPDTTSGVGGWGDINDDDQVTDGGFADGFPLSYPSPHKLRRHYYPTFAGRPNQPLGNITTPESQQAMVNGFTADFIGFQARFEISSHGAVHRMVGGDLFGDCPSTAPAGCAPGPKWSSNDPLFFMHHAMIDKLWYDWQHANPANFWSFDGGSVARVKNFVPEEAYPNGAPPLVTFATPIPTDGIMNEYTVYDLMDTQNEKLCYIYE